MTNVICLATERARRADQAACRAANLADCIHRAQPRAVASSLAALEPALWELPIPADPAASTPPIRWRTSSAGNPWCLVGMTKFVIFPSKYRDGEFCMRVDECGKPGFFAKRTWQSTEEAREWVEGYARDSVATPQPSRELSLRSGRKGTEP